MPSSGGRACVRLLATAAFGTGYLAHPKSNRPNIKARFGDVVLAAPDAHKHSSGCNSPCSTVPNINDIGRCPHLWWQISLRCESLAPVSKVRTSWPAQGRALARGAALPCRHHAASPHRVRLRFARGTRADVLHLPIIIGRQPERRWLIALALNHSRASRPDAPTTRLFVPSSARWRLARVARTGEIGGSGSIPTFSHEADGSLSRSVHCEVLHVLDDKPRTDRAERLARLALHPVAAGALGHVVADEIAAIRRLRLPSPSSARACRSCSECRVPSFDVANLPSSSEWLHSISLPSADSRRCVAGVSRGPHAGEAVN